MLNHHSIGKVGSPIRGICTHFQKLFPPVLMFRRMRQNVIIGHKPFLCLLVANRDFLCFCAALLLLLQFDKILFGLQGSEVKEFIFMIVKY